MRFALEAAEAGEVALIFKDGLWDTSTALAQGGMAVVQAPQDSFGRHIEDTLQAGAGLCDRDIVEGVICDAPSQLRDLLHWGASFDTVEGGGIFSLHREGGHSARRIIHKADATGREIQRTLLEAVKRTQKISIYAGYTAISILTTHRLGLALHAPPCVLGVEMLTPDHQIEIWLARKILVATGGCGQIYQHTTNPLGATGDGIALCYRAGIPVAGLEFFQFHPTALYHPKLRHALITEALRGEGARLLRADGDAFMARYHPSAEMAPRDIVARAIHREMQEHGDPCVYLDATHHTRPFLQSRFPTIYALCESVGIDMAQTPIPVVPAAHYCCGGVVSDALGRTRLRNLYVAGECAWTGLHGANRLASNALLEGLVFGTRAARHAVTSLHNQDPDAFALSDLAPSLPAPPLLPSSHTAEMTLDRSSPASSLPQRLPPQDALAQAIPALQRIMWEDVGIIRSAASLQRAHDALRQLNASLQNASLQNASAASPASPPHLRLFLAWQNLSLVASLLRRAASRRKESRGLHTREDIPTPQASFAHIHNHRRTLSTRR